MTLLDNRTYFTLEHPDRSLQHILMTIVNVISTITNSLLFYLIWWHSKKEKRLSKVVNFLQSLFLYLSQLHWGSFQGLVFLLPFPALYSIGLLSSVLSSFWLETIWIIIFSSFAIMMSLGTLIRLKAVSRADSFFNFKPTPSTILTFFTLSSALSIPVPFSWLSSYHSEDIVTLFVLQYYPNCHRALQIPGIFIFTDSSNLTLVIVCAIYCLLFGGFAYCLSCLAIVYEIRQQSRTMSTKNLNYHVKLLKDTIIQNSLRFLFLIIPPVFLFKNAYIPPETDTITSNIIANALFVAAPIPCTIVIFYQNECYRQFLKSIFMFWKQNSSLKISKAASIDLNNNRRMIIVE